MTLQQWIEQAEATEGERYLEARAQVAAGGEPALALLHELCSPAQPWRTARTAEMLISFLQDGKLRHTLEARLRGRFAPGVGPPISGAWDATDRGREIAALGAGALPPVLEALTRTHAFQNEVEREALFAALLHLADPRAVPPLLEMLGSDRPEPVRYLAAHTLGRLRTREAAAPLAALAADDGAELALRRKALVALLWIGDRAALERLLESSPADLRADVAAALDVL
ncbi:MAG: hypothetical protein QOH06_2118 [Acidobacteriota bacterium]|nr:hypothetical protein [Acidobacteriota bacterium]